MKQGAEWRVEQGLSRVDVVDLLIWLRRDYGSACGPVIVPVFKTGERHLAMSLVGSTPTRFRH